MYIKCESKSFIIFWNQMIRFRIGDSTSKQRYPHKNLAMKSLSFAWKRRANLRGLPLYRVCFVKVLVLVLKFRNQPKNPESDRWLWRSPPLCAAVFSRLLSLNVRMNRNRSKSTKNDRFEFWLKMIVQKKWNYFFSKMIGKMIIH